MQKILVTRPVLQALPLIEALKAEGCEPIALPMLTIEPIDERSPSSEIEAIESQFKKIHQLQGLIFISTNAVDGFFYWLNRLNKELPNGISVLAIGKATSERLNVHGVVANFSLQTASNSEALLTLPECQSVNGQQWSIVKGHGGREYLKQALAARGANVNYLPVYRRNVINYADKELVLAVDQKLAFIILTSGESLNQLCAQATFDAIEKEVLAIPIIVPGKRIYQVATTKGFKTVVIAENASVSAILKVIRDKGCEGEE